MVAEARTVAFNHSHSHSASLVQIKKALNLDDMSLQKPVFFIVIQGLALHYLIL